MILKAIQAVSRYALENEAEFIADLQSVWDENKAKSEDTGQQELKEAQKRMAELDAMIQNLYESSMKGVLPERQARRMIQQYDEEQILLERRIEELENQIRQESVKKADTERFLALVKKYRDCHELTDAMLYSRIRLPSPSARRTSATSRLASRRDCWCSRKRWSRSRRSMTNETAAGVRLDDPAAVSFIKKLRSEGETGPPERQKSFYRCAFSRIHFHHAISNANVCLDILGRTRLFFQLFA